jgi:hypothetical protein
MTQNYLSTNFQKKYCESYWGTCENFGQAEIFANRNSFVTQLNVEKYLSITSCEQEKSLNKIFGLKDNNGETLKDFNRDHIEYYESKNKTTICIFSNGHGEISDEIFNLIGKNGYFEIPPMYDTSQRTFMKIV